MAQATEDELVESRVAQLQEISKRRNELLAEMFSLIRRRDNIGSILTLDDGEEDLQVFLQKHDLSKHPDTGSIDNLHDLSLFARKERPDVMTVDEEHDQSVDSADELDLIERPSRVPTPLRRSHSVSEAQGMPAASVVGGEQAQVASEDVIMYDAEPPAPVKVKEQQNAPVVPQMTIPVGPKKEEEEEEEESAMAVDQNIETPQDSVPPTASASTVATPSADIPAQTVRPQDLQLTTPTVSQPSSTPKLPDFVSDDSPKPTTPSRTKQSSTGLYHQFDPQYTLPPIKSLPAEFSRRGKPKNKKREKEGKKDRDRDKDDWTSLGLNRWGFTITANPVWRRVAKASKCLTTRDWCVAMAELRIHRVIDRVESLKDAGKWSFRQPKKQRAVDNISKTHWDYLMDEMKWMRIDFREERKWKIAVAYNLSTAVLEWHAAGSTEERINQGICVLWRRPLDDEAIQEEDNSVVIPDGGMDVDDQVPAQDITQESQGMPIDSLLRLDYASDDDDGDDQDRESVVDALETAAMIEESLDRLENETEGDDNPGRIEPDFEPTREPKIEEVDYSSSLQRNASMEVDSKPLTQAEPSSSQDPSKAFRAGAVDAVLGSKSTSPGGPEPPLPTSKTSKINMYAPVRERIVFSDVDKLFVDLDDFKFPTAPSSLDSNEFNVLPVADLTDLFPDLTTLSLFDPPPLDAPPMEVKKRDKKIDKDDGTKRIDEFTQSKVFPVGKFMTTKPTLVSALQPGKRWRDEQWLPWEEAPVSAVDNPSIKALDESASDLFGRAPSRDFSRFTEPGPSNKPSVWSPKDDTSLTSNKQFSWSAKDDELLKSLIEKYGSLEREKATNWFLIAECFNASRICVPSDKRVAGDCLLRWRMKWGPPAPDNMGEREAPSTPSIFGGGASVPSTPLAGSMMTRGVKRLASNSVSSVSTPAFFNMGGEEPKSKRHKTVQDCMRKLVKRRAELAAKNSARKNNNVHETHAQYAKLPAKTPGELLRLKMEKDKKDQLESAAYKAQAQAAAQARNKGAAPAAQQQTSQAQQQGQVPQQQPQTQQVLQTQQGVNGQAASAPVPGQVPVQAQMPSQAPAQPKPANTATSIPIRNQVNISQQRIASPLVPNTRPQQMLRNQHSQQQGLTPHSQLTPQQIQSAIQHLQAQTAAAQAAAMTVQGANGTAAGFRDATSSPSLNNNTATTNVNSPRPASTQPRAQNISGHYYLPTTVPPYTAEHLQIMSMRYQAQHQQHMAAAHSQAQAQAQANQQQQPGSQ